MIDSIELNTFLDFDTKDEQAVKLNFRILQEAVVSLEAKLNEVIDEVNP